MRRRLEGLAFLSNGLLFASFFVRGPYSDGRNQVSEEMWSVFLVNIFGTLCLTIYFYCCLRKSDPVRERLDLD